jgi:hypothetical protein
MALCGSMLRTPVVKSDLTGADWLHPGPERDDPSVANSIVSSGDVGPSKAIVRRGTHGRLGLWLAVR